MTIRAGVGLVVAWVVSLVGVAAIAMAQAQSPQTASPTVIFGENLGFRVEGMQAGVPVGRMVIRIDGQWVEVGLEGGGMTPVAR
ncbi:MAG: hypothetical protein EXQ55_01270 [Acidobacteria bacterium]|nr:hypothetical protein [Acidobacteriota bacterium]